jgi:hypothetical protein
MLPLPPVIAWTLGAVGAVFISKLLAREWRRVNAELDARERATAPMRPQEFPASTGRSEMQRCPRQQECPILETFDEFLLKKSGTVGTPSLTIRKPIPPAQTKLFP